MIKKSDISLFFDQEAEAAKKSWEALIDLPIKERVRKRKAIDNVYLDKDYSDMSPENERLLKLHIGANLSDFKEGDCLILHQDQVRDGIKCTLYKFEGEEVIYVSVFPPNMPGVISVYHDKPLVLDKDCVDLRPNVYSRFIASLSYEDSFWRNHIINTCKKPTFENVEFCKEKLDETIGSYKLTLTNKQYEAILNSMSARDYYLIQGPPGTGKSFVLGVIMAEELFDLNHKVIVIGPNHHAINNALGQMLKFCPGYQNLIKVGQSYNAPTQKIVKDDSEYGIENLQRINGYAVKGLESPWLIGLTPHSLYTSRAQGLECDTLIIDEAGQVTIPLAMMGMIKAKKIIFAGDHKQLAPIITSEKVSDEMKSSAFQRLMKDQNCTMLDISFRMCEPICQFVSELFYEGEVKAHKSGPDTSFISDDPLYSYLTPVVLHDVKDEGEQTSDLEAKFIVDTITEYLKKGVKSEEIAVLAPFRAQAATVRRLIRNSSDISDEDKEKLAVDTVDKMQGQEREVIFYSMTSGDTEYIEEMGEFLYNPNKLNVAFSRAESKLIITANVEKLRHIDNAQFPHMKKILESDYVVCV